MKKMKKKKNLWKIHENVVREFVKKSKMTKNSNQGGPTLKHHEKVKKSHEEHWVHVWVVLHSPAWLVLLLGNVLLSVAFLWQIQLQEKKMKKQKTHHMRWCISVEKGKREGGRERERERERESVCVCVKWKRECQTNGKHYKRKSQAQWKEKYRTGRGPFRQSSHLSSWQEKKRETIY